MNALELRNKYLDFFKRHGHKVIPSAPLIPENDPSVLFNTAGMQPLVPYLLGQKHPEGTRLTDYQKCIRTNDIDEVGDNRHLTYFEMLGNWSLGDYFKEESIAMSFEFLTKDLEIPVDKLSVTCFGGNETIGKDEESASYWEKAGIPRVQESQNVHLNVTLIVIVENMLKFGTMYLWNFLNTKMEQLHL